MGSQIICRQWFGKLDQRQSFSIVLGAKFAALASSTAHPGLNRHGRPADSPPTRA